MGVLPNLRRVTFPGSDSHEEAIVSSHDSDSEADGHGGEVARLVRQYPSASTALSPASRRKFCGHKLTLKKGRRSRNRYENERMLFASAEIDLETAPDGRDIANEARSHFRQLLTGENRALLDRFLSTVDEDEELCRSEISQSSRRVPCQERGPEDAFLSIHSNIRAAIKKHLPWGMLENLDSEICDFFASHPDAEFIFKNLSSYERLLAHACSMYYQLRSRSYDIEGSRILRIENPWPTFNPLDPSLTQYLKKRNFAKTDRHEF